MNTTNRLRYSMVYLVGPMEDGREEGRQWRKVLTPFLESLDIVVLDPYKKPVLVDPNNPCLGLEDDASHEYIADCSKNRDFNGLSKIMKHIRNFDLRMVDKSDFLIVNYDINKKICGTLEEIVTANRQKKVVLIKCENKSTLPPWLYAMLPHQLFFENWLQIKDYLWSIAFSDRIDYKSRWTFFDVSDRITQISNNIRMYPEKPM